MKQWSTGISGTVHTLLIVGMANIGWNPENAWDFSVAQGKSAMLSVTFAQQVASHDAPVPLEFVELDASEEEMAIAPPPLRESEEERPKPRGIEVEATKVDHAEVANAPFPPLAARVETASVPPVPRKSWEDLPQVQSEPLQRLPRRVPPERSPDVTPPLALAKQTTASDSSAAEADPGAVFDEPPAKLPENKAPEYPIAARLAGVEGRVLLSVKIDASGRVRAVQIDQSSGDASLDQSALEAVRSWRFSPAKRKGASVDAEVLVPIRFTLRTT